MKHAFYRIVIFILLLPLSVFGQDNWNLVKEEDGVKIYTKPEPGSAYRAFKGEMLVNCRIEDIIEVLKNTKNINNWVANCKDIKLLKTEGFNQYYYIETSLPWPFENRDMVYHYQYVQVRSGQVRINVTGIPDYIEPRDGIVRLEKAGGYWLLTSANTNQVMVTYQMHMEPGGMVPSWLANSYIHNVPFSTFRGLRNLVQK